MDQHPYEEPKTPPKNDPEWRNMLLAWEKEFFEGLEELGPPEKVAACRHPIKKAIRSTLDWCLAHGEGIWATKEKLSDTASLVRDVYDAVTDPQNASPKLKNRSTLWRHAGLSSFLTTATLDELARPFDINAVKDAANTYIACRIPISTGSSLKP
jgi:hypothetical protein